PTSILTGSTMGASGGTLRIVEMAGQRLDRLGGYDFAALIARYDRDVRQRVDGVSRLHQPRKHATRIVIPQERTILLLRDAIHENVEIGLEPDRNAMRPHRLARLLVHEGPAAGREHLRPPFQKACDHALLQRAELGF